MSYYLLFHGREKIVVEIGAVRVDSTSCYCIYVIGVSRNGEKCAKKVAMFGETKLNRILMMLIKKYNLKSQTFNILFE